MDDRVEQVVDITQVCLEKQTLRNIVSFLAIFPSHFPQKEQFLFKAFIDFLSLILVYMTRSIIVSLDQGDKVNIELADRVGVSHLAVSYPQVFISYSPGLILR